MEPAWLGFDLWLLLQAQEDYERRLREEMDAKSLKEQEIERLVRVRSLVWGNGEFPWGAGGMGPAFSHSCCPVQAQLELELIERLKLKQSQQRKAYDQLEAVLTLGGVR